MKSVAISLAICVLATRVLGAEPPAGGAVPGAVSAVVALDTSQSMRGFKLEDLEPILDDIARALDVRGIRGPAAEMKRFGVREDLTPLALPLTPQSFGGQRADLQTALRNPQLTAADVWVLITDGQPTPANVRTRSCAYSEKVELAGSLGLWMESSIRGDMRLWIVLERLPFDGEFFLNCGVPQAGQASLGKDRGMRCDPECHYPYAGDRALLTLVAASKSADSVARRFISDYLEARPRAEAIRLHEPTEPEWSAVSPPEVLLFAPPRPDQPTAPRTRISPGDVPVRHAGAGAQSFIADVRCTHRALGFGACLRSAPSATPVEREFRVVRMSDPVMRADPPLRNVVIDVERGFAPELLNQVRSWERDDCPSVWGTFEVLARDHAAIHEAPINCPTSSADVRAIELVGFCGCHPSDSTQPVEQQIELIHGYDVRDVELQNLLASKGFAADEKRWFDQPDRIHGLSELLLHAARVQDERLQGQTKPLQSLRLTIAPARTTTP